MTSIARKLIPGIVIALIVVTATFAAGSPLRRYGYSDANNCPDRRYDTAVFRYVGRSRRESFLERFWCWLFRFWLWQHKFLRPLHRPVEYLQSHSCNYYSCFLHKLDQHGLGHYNRQPKRVTGIRWNYR